MFRDKVKIKVKAGRGGDGIVRFDYMQRPSGGNGGRGGNVYLKCTTNEYDLYKIKPSRVYKAKPGEIGGNNNATGANGDHQYILVPPVTIAYDENNNEIGRVSKHNETLLLAKGGRGGLGNHHFRKGQLDTLETRTLGKEGEAEDIELVLNLQSDVLFIGLPNAGKSTILNEITNAESKVASYAFTTIDPIIGQLNGKTLMDLPGLIEGTAEGKGVGTKFVKHTTNAESIAHFLSLENVVNLIKDYKLMRGELEEIDKKLSKEGQKLSKLKEVIVLTKKDLIDDAEVESIIKKIKKETKNDTVIAVSILDEESLEELKELMKNK